MARCTPRRLAAAAVVAAAAAVVVGVAPRAAAQAPTTDAGSAASSPPPPAPPTSPTPAAATATPTAAAGRDQPVPTWSYGGATGPATWHTLNPAAYGVCDTGNAQSPVNVATVGAAVDAAGTTVETLVRSAGNTTFTTRRVANNVIFSCTAGCGRLSWDGRTYGLAGVAVHAAAEHPIDGVNHAMEVQFAFTAPSGAAVRLAVVLSLAVKPHPLVEALVDAIEADDNGGRLIVAPADMATLLVPESGFCTWSGSLTTPPCTEGIRWFLQTTILGVTPSQVAAFTAARGGGRGNARPVQPGSNATRVTGCYGPPPPTPPPTPPPAPPPGSSDGAGSSGGRGDDDDDGNSLCFPAAATVVTAGGAVTALGDLPSGAAVAVAVTAAGAPGTPPSVGVSKVFLWSHRLAGGWHPFVRLSTARHGSLTLSAGHLVYVGGVPVPAGTVVVGDVLAAVAPPADATCTVAAAAAAAAAAAPTATAPSAAAACGGASGGFVAAPVTAVTRVHAAGLYHPHTLAGEPLVDGFHVSALTTAVGGGRAAGAALAAAARLYGLVGWAWGGLEGGEWGRGAAASALAALG